LLFLEIGKAQNRPKSTKIVTWFRYNSQMPLEEIDQTFNTVVSIHIAVLAVLA